MYFLASKEVVLTRGMKYSQNSKDTTTGEDNWGLETKDGAHWDIWRRAMGTRTCSSSPRSFAHTIC